MTKLAQLLKTAMILLPLACAACGDTRPTLILPPTELAVCADEPAAPDLPPVDWTSPATARPVQRARDLAMLDYVLALRTAWGDCRADVDGLAAWRAAAD